MASCLFGVLLMTAETTGLDLGTQPVAVSFSTIGVARSHSRRAFVLFLDCGGARQSLVQSGRTGTEESRNYIEGVISPWQLAVGSSGTPGLSWVVLGCSSLELVVYSKVVR